MFCGTVFTRLQTKESALKVRVLSPQLTGETALIVANAQSGSAFMIDVSQVSLALRRATSRSLLIIDEFGKGAHLQLCPKTNP